MENGPIKYDDAEGTHNASEKDHLADRRKPGRRDEISRHLAPLLRESERAKMLLSMIDDIEPVSDKYDAGDQSTAYQSDLSDGPGVVLGVIIGSIIWIGIASALLSLFG